MLNVVVVVVESAYVKEHTGRTAVAINRKPPFYHHISRAEKQSNTPPSTGLSFYVCSSGEPPVAKAPTPPGT